LIVIVGFAQGFVFAAHWDTSSPPILSEGKCIQLPETPGRQSKLLTVSLPVWTWDDFRCEMMCNALHCSIANARINQLTAIGDACHMLTSNLASQNMFNHGMQYIINYYRVHIYSYMSKSNIFMFINMFIDVPYFALMVLRSLKDWSRHRQVPSVPWRQHRRLKRILCRQALR
jgi:hypothetical protein